MCFLEKRYPKQPWVFTATFPGGGSGIKLIYSHSDGHPMGGRSFDPLEFWILCGMLTDGVWSVKLYAL